MCSWWSLVERHQQNWRFHQDSSETSLPWTKTLTQLSNNAHIFFYFILFFLADRSWYFFSSSPGDFNVHPGFWETGWQVTSGGCRRVRRAMPVQHWAWPACGPQVLRAVTCLLCALFMLLSFSVNVCGMNTDVTDERLWIMSNVIHLKPWCHFSPQNIFPSDSVFPSPKVWAWLISGTCTPSSQRISQHPLLSDLTYPSSVQTPQTHGTIPSGLLLYAKELFLEVGQTMMYLQLRLSPWILITS